MFACVCMCVCLCVCVCMHVCVCVFMCVHMHDAVHEGTLREQQPVHSDLSEPFVGRDTAAQAEQNPFFLHASVGSEYHTK